MEVIVNKEDEKLVYEVGGRIDSTTAPELEEVINENLGDYKDVSIDFSKVEYISSAGLRVLLATQKKLKDGELKILNPNEVVEEIFEITGFMDILNVVK